MARIRTIKPEFFTSLTIGELTFEQRLTFIGLWTHADDAGRCVDEARLIRGALWSVDDRPVADVESDLRALHEASLIVRYVVNRRRYLVISGWEEHQKINRPTPSKIPAPEQGEITPPEPTTCSYEDSMNSHGGRSEASRPERKGKEQGTGNRESSSSVIDERPGALQLVAPAVDEPATHRDDVEKICLTLADRIEANGSKRPNITTRWRTSARLMLDKDHRTLEQVLTAIDWCQSDEFWRSNILSVPKLREKYDQLRLSAQRQQRASLAPTGTHGHTAWRNPENHDVYDDDLFGDR